MCAWGASFKSCDDLIARIERNDPSLVDLTILPTKTFGDEQLDRLSTVLETATAHQQQLHWRTISASGHALSCQSLERFGKAATASSAAGGASTLSGVALGDSTMGDEGVAAFCSGMAASSSSSSSGGGGETCCCLLETLDLSYKGMSVAGFKSLVDSMSSRGGTACCCPNLTLLSLARNTLALPLDDPHAFSSVAVMFPSLQELDLSACDLNETFAQVVFPLLQCPTLRLSSNPSMGDAGFKALLQQGGDHLKGLHVSDCHLSDASMDHLHQLTLSACQTLDLSSNLLTAGGAAKLGPCLASGCFPKLDIVNLSGNAIGPDGVTAVVQGLVAAGTAGISLLDLSETECDQAGASFAVQHAQAIGLRSLRLYNNHLGSLGLFAMAQVLPSALLASSSCCFLETLDVAGNGAGQESVVALLNVLLEAIKAGSALAFKCIIVGGNQGGEQVEAAIQQIKDIRPDIDVARDKIKKHR